MNPFKEIAKFVADTAGLEKLNSFRPSAAAEKRIAKLLTRKREGSLRFQEREELQLFVQLDHVLSLARALAKRQEA